MQNIFTYKKNDLKLACSNPYRGYLYVPVQGDQIDAPL